MKLILNLRLLVKATAQRWILFAVISTLFVVSTFLFIVGPSNASSRNMSSDFRTSSTKSGNALQESTHVIDGFTNPDSIPPEVAYSIFFRMLTGGKNQISRSHSRALAKSLLLSDQDINSLFAVAGEFSQQVSLFDDTATRIKDKYHPDHGRIPATEDRAILTDLQKRKDKLVLKLAGILPQRLSPEGWYKVHQYIQETIRRKTKIAIDDEK